jgi:hypothetical protein
VVSLVKDASLTKPIGSQWEGNPFIKDVMLTSDLLDLNGANKAASKLFEKYRQNQSTANTDKTNPQSIQTRPMHTQHRQSTATTDTTKQQPTQTNLIHNQYRENQSIPNTDTTNPEPTQKQQIHSQQRQNQSTTKTNTTN